MMSRSKPVSSRTSRRAASSSDSPGSTLPLGSVQSSYRGRWTTSTSMAPRGVTRQTRPPAALTLVVLRGLRTALLGAAAGGRRTTGELVRGRGRHLVGAGQVDADGRAAVAHAPRDPAADLLGRPERVNALAALGPGVALGWPGPHVAHGHPGYDRLPHRQSI